MLGNELLMLVKGPDPNVWLFNLSGRKVQICWARGLSGPLENSPKPIRMGVCSLLSWMPCDHIKRVESQGSWFSSMSTCSQAWKIVDAHSINTHRL